MDNKYIIELLKELKEECIYYSLFDTGTKTPWKHHTDKAEALNYAIFILEKRETEN